MTTVAVGYSLQSKKYPKSDDSKIFFRSRFAAT